MARLMWLENVGRKDDGYVGRRMRMIELPVKCRNGECIKRVYGTGGTSESDGGDGKSGMPTS